MDSLSDHAYKKPVGAIVTFEFERTQQVALDLWAPSPLGLYAACTQPYYARMTDKKKKKRLLTAPLVHQNFRVFENSRIRK